jgi:hypothetical protein
MFNLGSLFNPILIMVVVGALVLSGVLGGGEFDLSQITEWLSGLIPSAQ